jgi:aminomethyltransferase
MGEFLISGTGALKNLRRLLTNDFADMKTGRVRYTLLCNETGGVIDDLVVCKLDDERFMLVVNAANREKDFSWIKNHLDGASGGVSFKDISDTFAQIAIQGPLAPVILAKLSTTIPEKYYTLIEKGAVAGIGCIVSRTGYTGEAGFELYCRPEDSLSLWEKIMEAGKDAGLVPCGLGARDTLRLEAAMPLYGHELSETITPFEAGLSFAVKMEKPDFIGKAALLEKQNPARIRTGIKITGKGIAREGSEVFAGPADGKAVGVVTSGTFCPHLEEAVAMALVEKDASVPGTLIGVDIRGRRTEGIITALPFYKRSS